MIFLKILLMMNWLWKVDSVDLNKINKTSTSKEKKDKYN